AQDRKETHHFRELQQQLSALGSKIHQYSREIEHPQPGKIAHLQNTYGKILTELRILYDSLQNNLGAAYKKEESIQQICQKSNRLNETLVDYFIGQKTVYQIVIKPSGIDFKKLTSSEKEYQH